jgi:hypothetical protein
VIPFREQHRSSLVVTTPPGIAAASVCEVRCQEDVQAEISKRALERHETNPLRQHVAPGVGQYFLFDAIPSITGRVVNPIRRNAWRHL